MDSKRFKILNNKTGTWHQAVWNKDLPKGVDGNSFDANKLPSHFHQSYYDKAIWIFTPVPGGSNKWWIDSVKNWTNAGFVFESEKEESVKTTKDLQEKLIDYCAIKASRAKHLKALTRLGALSANATYDEVAETIKTYLNTEPDICTDGAGKAIKALGLEPPKKWVRKELASTIVYSGCEETEYRFVGNANQSDPDAIETRIRKTDIGSWHYDAMIPVWVQE